jgi:hypothetical protein
LGKVFIWAITEWGDDVEMSEQQSVEPGDDYVDLEDEYDGFENETRADDASM